METTIQIQIRIHQILTKVVKERMAIAWISTRKSKTIRRILKYQCHYRHMTTDATSTFIAAAKLESRRGRKTLTNATFRGELE